MKKYELVLMMMMMIIIIIIITTDMDVYSVYGSDKNNIRNNIKHKIIVASVNLKSSYLK